MRMLNTASRTRSDVGLTRAPDPPFDAYDNEPLLSDVHTKSVRSLAKRGGDEPPAPGRNGERDFHGEKRANDMHASTTDPDAKLFRKGDNKPAKLCYMGHALIENRHGLVVRADASQASGTAERGAALDMIDRHEPGSE